MKKLAFATLLALCVLAPSHSAFAHVFITDDTNTKGAILHIIPDDDPVAGDVATLFFDTQKQLLSSDDSVVLVIRDEAGNEYDVAAKLNGSLVTADFTFPETGIYELIYTVSSNGQSYTFRQSQRVSRGQTSSVSNRETYAWAEALLLASGVSFVILLIIAFNRRKDIARQSKL